VKPALLEMVNLIACVVVFRSEAGSNNGIWLPFAGPEVVVELSFSRAAVKFGLMCGTSLRIGTGRWRQGIALGGRSTDSMRAYMLVAS
jgi:hypothetical protein